MKNVKVKFLKPYRTCNQTYKVGDVYEISKIVAMNLISLGIAVEVDENNQFISETSTDANEENEFNKIEIKEKSKKIKKN